MKSWQELEAAFIALEGLNLRVLAELDRGLDLDTLQGLFDQKAARSASLSGDHALNPSEGLPEGLNAVQAAQARAARSETKVAERLAQLVPSIGKKFPFYGSQKLDKPGSRYDNAV